MLLGSTSTGTAMSRDPPVRNPSPLADSAAAPATPNAINSQSSPVKQTQRAKSRQDVQKSWIVQNTPIDEQFIEKHLSSVPLNSKIAFASLTTEEKDLFSQVVRIDTLEHTLYDPFTDLLTLLSRRIHATLPENVREMKRVVEFIPNARKYMTGHPHASEEKIGTSYAPDCVGVEGLRERFVESRDTHDKPVYRSIAYQEAATLIEELCLQAACQLAALNADASWQASGKLLNKSTLTSFQAGQLRHTWSTWSKKWSKKETPTGLELTVD
ncbi:hypothetical protein NM688_g3844 [Phlebia brevispora]|uniref:Uncharacterized protein n=1 Tax=Phlebia brevispora TaxID=194682 RepID=A0ACC1T4R9_9APHY|nr:hypothetical protein NM688_g3844 [Phlebia brevispora]